MKIRFVRCFKMARPEMSKRRLSAARRVLARKNDKVALFPEMQDKTTPEERVNKSLDGIVESVAELRSKICLEWRAVRAMLGTMPPPDRDRFLGYWNTSGYPGNADTCLSQLKQFQAGRLDIDKIVSELRWIRRWGRMKLSDGWHSRSLWLPKGDPMTDEIDPRLIDAYREGAD